MRSRVDGEYIVDTGHIVAFNETLNFSLSKAGKSWMSSILGGEGLVCRFQGPRLRLVPVASSRQLRPRPGGPSSSRAESAVPRRLP